MSQPEHPAPDNGPLFPVAPPQKIQSFGSGLRTWFLTGVVIAGPLAVTGWLVWWFIATVDEWVRPVVPPALWPDTYLPVRVPGTGVVLAVLGLTMLGFLAANLAGRTLLRLGEMMLDQMPVVRGIYKAVKQVFETVFSQQSSSFRRVCLIQFPAKGMWSVAFLSSPPAPMLAEALPGTGDYVSVFMPCTPNPTSGFFFYLPAADVIEVAMTPDEAFKLIMSAGVLQPGGQQKLAELAEAAQRDKASATS
jgi:uncharacterized membrane protein